MKRRRNGEPAHSATFPDRSKLPINAHSAEILNALEVNDVVVLIAETGSGKTTQLPQIILNDNPQASLVVTQPRRVAAISVASRVAKEMQTEVGRKVGYAVRFQDCSKKGITRVRYVTDGVLLREVLGKGVKGMRKRYSHVLIDEVHERRVNTDLILGVMKRSLEVAKQRQKEAGENQEEEMPFKVVVMSATTDAEKVVNFFQEDTGLKVSALHVKGRKHNVSILYSVAALKNYLDSIPKVIEMIHMSKKDVPGDVLVFLPGQEEIMTSVALTKGLIKKKSALQGLRCFPLYAAMSPEEQMKAIEPLPDSGNAMLRKVIFATNIAETSITIPGVVFVIDTGLVKVRSVFNYKGLAIETLQTQSVSQAQAEQRRGRVGRTQDGIAYRLFREEDFKTLERYPRPEILLADAGATLLQIMALCDNAKKSKVGVDLLPNDPKAGKNGAPLLPFQDFPLIDDIPIKLKAYGLETLCILGVVNQKMELQQAGRLIARIPVPPMLGRSLLESSRVGCVEAMVSVAAVLTVEGMIFLSPARKREQARKCHRRFMSEDGDPMTQVNALDAFMQIHGIEKRRTFCHEYMLNYRTLLSAESIRHQLARLMKHGDMIGWGISNPLPQRLRLELQEEGTDRLVRRCLVAGYFRNVVEKREDGKYVHMRGREKSTVIEQGLDVHPSSFLKTLSLKNAASHLIYNELLMTSRFFLLNVVRIEREWLSDHCGHYFGRGMVAEE